MIPSGRHVIHVCTMLIRRCNRIRCGARQGESLFCACAAVLWAHCYSAVCVLLLVLSSCFDFFFFDSSSPSPFLHHRLVRLNSGRRDYIIICSGIMVQGAIACNNFQFNTVPARLRLGIRIYRLVCTLCIMKVSK